MRSTLVLAPLFAVASSVVAPPLKSDARDQLAVIAAHPDRWYWFTLLLLIGSILFVPALLWIAGLVRSRAPRLGEIGGALAVLGAVIAVGDVMTQFVSWQMVSGDANVAQMAAALDRFENAGGATVVFTVGGLSILIGCVLLTVGLIRQHLAPAWAAVGLSLAVVANIVAFTAASNAGVLASWILLLVSMGALAARPSGRVVAVPIADVVGD
jgi:hypothetical protein